ncbi:DUF397 domain-containing protein [Streptomyces sp. NPDC004682]
MRNTPELGAGPATWRKSTYSGGSGGNCLEVAAACPIRVRDSKRPLGPKLAFQAGAWSAFVKGIKLG